MKRSIVFFISMAVLACATPAWCKQTKLMLIGDGTMADCTAVSDSEVRGWGQMLSPYLSDDVVVVNVAAEGMSAKTVLSGNCLDSLLSTLSKRDIVLIQLGQNDLREDRFEQYSSVEDLSHRLAKIVDVAKDKKLRVFLCTPLAQPFYRDGLLIDRLGSYPEASRRVAGQKEVPLLDLEAMTKEWLTQIGEDGAYMYYVNLDTHHTPTGEYLLNEAGAMHVCQMVVSAIRGLNDKKLNKLIAAPVLSE